MSLPHLHCYTSLHARVTHLVPEEAARDVDLLAPHNDDFLAIEHLLRDNRSKPPKEVALAINNDGGRGEGGHRESEVALNTSSLGDSGGENEHT